MSNPQRQPSDGFPAEMADESRVNRRGFAIAATLAGAGYALAQLAANRAAEHETARESATLPSELIRGAAELPVGGAMKFQYPSAETGPDASCVVVRLGNDEFVAYRDRCTHLMCGVRPRVDRGELHCPCHKGVFDLKTGNATLGPPRRALTRVKLRVEAGAVWAVGLSGGA